MRKLVVLAGNAEGTEFTLRDDCVYLGRDESCQILLTDPGLSRHHALLIADGAEYRVCDLDSGNGTFLNGELITESPLTPGDVLRCGLSELRYEIVKPAPIEPTSRPLVRSQSRGMWMSVTIVAAVVSAGVTFFLASRLPQRAVELATPHDASASVAVTPAAVYRDAQGRFTCDVPAGWRVDEETATDRTKVNLSWGNDEIRIVTQPAPRAALTEAELAGVLRGLAQWGALRGASWRSVGLVPAWQAELETPAPAVTWVRLVKFRQRGADHTIALFAGTPARRDEAVRQFEEFLQQYRAH